MYSFNVSMYRSPPEGTEDLTNLVNMARERLKLYSFFENNMSASLDELQTHMAESPLVMLLQNQNTSNVQVARRLDYNSQWILRVAYKDMPEIFIRNELKWFKLRFNLMEEQDQLAFLKENNFTFKRVTEDERIELNLSSNIFYKIKFLEIPAVVKSRRYPLRDGHVFIPGSEIVHWLSYKLENLLKASLVFAKKSRLSLLQDDQLQTILSFLDLVKPSYKFDVCNPISLGEIDEASDDFPLCMRCQHETLRKTHHLKHFSRLQYGLFLKGIGLSLEEALTFWKEEFLHTMPEAFFCKKYVYRVKHLYGTVGRKFDYAPFSCGRVIEQLVDVNQTHGCPFKHWDDGILVKKLKEYGIEDAEINTILTLKSREKYTDACTKYFECVYSCKPDNPIMHPNQYFANGWKLRNSLTDIEDLFHDSE